MVFEKLTEQDCDLIQQYIKTYCPEDNEYSLAKPQAELPYLLRFWDEAKSSYLYKIFGEQLILSKEVTFQKDIEELEREVNNKLLWGSSNNVARLFIEEFKEKFYYSTFGRYDRMMERNMMGLISEDSLVSNVYNRSSFEITAPSGKVIKINNGCKVIKILNKIANAFGLGHFEEFRIAHSQILNQKYLHGNLCLSIHPMDYMTMSDNDNDWDSCMSWRNYGGYRAGTVEMLNSKCVIVAYLTSENSMTMFGDKAWNNKKWRELFIVTPEVITGIKGYPYLNPDLEKIVLSWLKDLVNLNGDFPAYRDKVYEYSTGYPLYLDDSGEDVKMSFTCNRMYNDFYDHHFCLISSELKQKSFTINYSGEFSCMNCGEVDDGCNEDTLICEDCDDSVRCSDCGDRINRDDIHDVDDQYLCSYCYEEHTTSCDICDEVHLNGNIVEVRLALDDAKITNLVINLCEDCSQDPRNKLKDYFMIESFHTVERYWNHIYYVLIDECTKKGLSLFDINTEEDMKNLKEEIIDW